MSADRAHMAQMQLRLPLKQETSRRASDLEVSTSNAVAAEALEDWPSEPGSIMALYGPAGSGKSHMAAAWVERVGAIALHGEEAAWCDPLELEGRPVLLEEAEGADDEALFHLINLTQSGGGALLMVSRDPPASWMVRLPDLKSRLNSVRTIAVEVPDDVILAAMLKRSFAARNIVPGDGVIEYLVRRIDRSAQSAEMIVDRLDMYHRPVTRVLARQVLEGDFTAGLS
ncbi:MULTISPECIES: DnaA/Hda family protein [unclassified Brevundimonas]|uniref:DnaA/Hda family protein n=1 Tax=unclassified Brevundimonas TaxID=2622653 RepID=UPI0025C5C0DB|nr:MULTISPECIES: DnaA/Hda family protein [unclassified Brevundimonas]